MKKVMLLSMIVMTLICSSCGHDGPSLDDDDNNSGWNSDSGNSSKDEEKIVKSNVKISVSYSDYTTTFTFTSTLVNAMPGRNFEFGIGHGTTPLPVEMPVSVGYDAYSYSSVFNGNTERITIKNPFFYYYAFVARDNEKLAMCQTYYDSYNSLKTKGLSNLKSDEKDLYYECVRYLDECEKEVKRNYTQVACVCTSGRFYYLKSYNIR